MFKGTKEGDHINNPKANLEENAEGGAAATTPQGTTSFLMFYTSLWKDTPGSLCIIYVEYDTKQSVWIMITVVHSVVVTL